MDDVSSNKLDESGVLALLGKIMIGVIVFLSIVIVIIFFLHLYTKWFLNRRRQDAGGDSEGGGARGKVKPPQGLDPLILETIPIVAFDVSEFKDGSLECTICLCEFSEGEKMRFLPKCNHGFHVDCIDMWFQSHTTCPLCRNAFSTNGESHSQIMEEASDSASTSVSTELPILPTNVLFWGNETQVSTLCNPCLDSNASTSNPSHGGMLVIDIPRGVNEEEESRYVMPERLRRLMRLLSGDRRVISPSSSRNVDIEEGVEARVSIVADPECRVS